METVITGRVFACPLPRRSDTLHWDLIEYVEAVRGYAAGLCNDRGIDPPLIVMAHAALGGHFNAAEIPTHLRAMRTLGIRALLAPRFTQALLGPCFERGVLALPFEFCDEVDCADALVVDPEVGDVRNVSTGWAYRIAPAPRGMLRIWQQAQPVPRATRANTRRAPTAARPPRA